MRLAARRGRLYKILALSVEQQQSTWLGRLEYQYWRQRDEYPPFHIVFMVLKRAELRNLFLKAVEKVVAFDDRRTFHSLIIRLRSNREVDLYPILVGTLGAKKINKSRSIEVLEYAIAYMWSLQLPGVREKIWNLTLAKPPPIYSVYECYHVVRSFVDACLDD